MTKWVDIANANPFQKDVEKANEEQIETSSMVDTFYINTSDGRQVPVTVDNGTRSVYPVRKV